MRTMILCLALLMLTMPCLAQDNAVVERHSDYNMVVVHGLGADASIWDECIGPLRRGFNVWAFELPGHGRTQPVANASIDSFAELLAEFIEKEGIQNPALVGHGMGWTIRCWSWCGCWSSFRCDGSGRYWSISRSNTWSNCW